MRKGVYFDQTAFIELVAGNKNILKVIDEAPAFYTGTHILALVLGVEEYMIEKKFLKDRKLRAIISNFKVLEIKKEESIKAAEIIGKLKANGEEIILDEALTASHVVLNDFVLITKDRELARKLKKMNVEVRVI